METGPMVLGPMAILAIAGGVIMLFIFLWMSINLYKKCGANEAMIVSGWGAFQDGRAFKIIVGGGDVVLPMLQQINILSLEIMTVELQSQLPIIMKDGVPASVSAVTQVKVGGDEVSIATAAEQLIGKSQEEIVNIVRQVLLTDMRIVLAKFTVAELLSRSDLLSVEFQHLPELARLGMKCVCFTIRDIKDNVGCLESLGRAQSAEAQKKVDIEIVNKKKEAVTATMETEIEVALLAELSINPLKRFELASEYERVLPQLEQTLGEQSLVFKDFLMRYAMVLAGNEDSLSIGKAQALMARAGKIGALTI